MRQNNPAISQGVVITDAAKRCADIINSYFAFIPYAELRDKWAAIRLQDGGSDGTLYDSKQDAVRHQTDEFLCVYVSFRNIGNGISQAEAQRYLDYNRMLYDGGARMPDPDSKTGGPDAFQSTTAYDTWVESYGKQFLANLGNLLRG